MAQHTNNFEANRGVESDSDESLADRDLAVAVMGPDSISRVRTDAEREETKKKVKPFMNLSLRRSPLKEKEVMLLLALRYGSLSDYTKVVNSYSAIRRQIGLNQSTVYAAI